MFQANLSLEMSLFLSAIATAAIGIVGTRLSGRADILADRTGIGEAFMGAVFLGATTSLPGITASVTAAIHGHAALALSNAFGGIAAQTAFLAIADMTYRKANLEHAAASLPNIMSGTLLIALLAMIMLAMVGPEISIGGIHPLTPLLFIGYALGLRMVYQSHEQPMWQPRITRETKPDLAEEFSSHGPSLPLLWMDFSISAAVVIVSGWILTHTAEAIVAQTNISEGFVGALILAVTTSLPELVTSIAAVKRGALTLAVGGVLGGNAFDTLFGAISDVVYRPGSIYHAATAGVTTLVALTILMSSILLIGLLFREKRGFANIGFESILVLILYLIGVIILKNYY
jgi:cation:H+ antiporter